MTGSLTQNRRSVNLVSKNDVFVKWGHEIIPRDAIYFFAEVSFRVMYGALQVRSLGKITVNAYRRRPQTATYVNVDFLQLDTDARRRE